MATEKVILTPRPKAEPLRLSKHYSDMLERMIQLNALIQFDGGHCHCGKCEIYALQEEYEVLLAKIVPVAALLINRLCKAGAISIFCSVRDLVNEPDAKNCYGIEGRPRFADADEDGGIDGRITLYLNKDCTNYFEMPDKEPTPEQPDAPPATGTEAVN